MTMENANPKRTQTVVVSVFLTIVLTQLLSVNFEQNKTQEIFHLSADIEKKTTTTTTLIPFTPTNSSRMTTTTSKPLLSSSMNTTTQSPRKQPQEKAKVTQASSPTTTQPTPRSSKTIEPDLVIWTKKLLDMTYPIIVSRQGTEGLLERVRAEFRVCDPSLSRVGNSVNTLPLDRRLPLRVPNPFLHLHQKLARGSIFATKTATWYSSGMPPK
jgi:hypothetical protein